MWGSCLLLLMEEVHLFLFQISVGTTYLGKKSTDTVPHARKFILTLMAYSTTFLMAFLGIMIHELGVGYVDGKMHICNAA